ncbi:MAG: hypothetical protein IIA89_10855 [Chloroflexi bacterium]|nr:hypothetical protein [Chloroflexota bacterium]
MSRNFFQVQASKWPVLLMFGLAGGIAAFLFAAALPRTYEASTIVGININYGLNDIVDELTEDRSLNLVLEMFMADSNLENTLEGLPASLRNERGWWTPADLRPLLRADRKLAQWALVASDPDPEVALLVSSTWAESSLRALDQAMNHSWRSLALQDQPSVVNCELVMNSEGTDDRTRWLCTSEALDPRSDQLAAMREDEYALSRGILPTVAFELLQSAGRPGPRIETATGQFVLLGGLLGMVVAWRLTKMPDSKSSPPPFER